MNAITERQKNILYGLVTEYIRFGLPISSEFLKTECCFDFSPATIRSDLAELTNDGFLSKTHISGGKVPTDKGYRFFVDSLLRKERTKSAKFKKEFQEIFRKVDDLLQMSHCLAENLARLSCNLALVGLEEMHIFWKEGWQNMAKAPEFENADYLKLFLNLANGIEQEINKIDFSGDEKIKIFIGQESPFKVKEFSVILGQGKISDKSYIFALLGPKRMDFQKNIYLIESLVDLF